MYKGQGYACGNGIEVAESLEVLAGGGPADVVELTVALARHMVKVAGLDGIDPADVLASGQAMDRPLYTFDLPAQEDM
ncbi:hypothetical protein [Salmonella enterica]|uniref:hypothetical protein n=1 Tax=Salmonella enterica TaxID=28901 RepID=UPI001C62C696|nr:hypothetical protein [Salmonella enterica]